MFSLVCGFFCILIPCANIFFHSQAFRQLINIKICAWTWSWKKIFDFQFHRQIQARSRHRGLIRVCTPKKDDVANPEIVYFQMNINVFLDVSRGNWKLEGGFVLAWLQFKTYLRIYILWRHCCNHPVYQDDWKISPLVLFAHQKVTHTQTKYLWPFSVCQAVKSSKRWKKFKTHLAVEFH